MGLVLVWMARKNKGILSTSVRYLLRQCNTIDVMGAKQMRSLIHLCAVRPGRYASLSEPQSEPRRDGGANRLDLHTPAKFLSLPRTCCSSKIPLLRRKEAASW